MRTITITILLLCSMLSAQTTEQWSKLERGMTEPQAVKLIGSPLDVRESSIGKISYYQENEKELGAVKYKKSTGNRTTCVVVSWKEPNWDLMPEPTPIRTTAVRPVATPVVAPVLAPEPKPAVEPIRTVTAPKPVRRTERPIAEVTIPPAVIPQKKWHSWYWLVLGLVLIGIAFLITLKYGNSWH